MQDLLLVLIFFLHVIPMNIALAGGFYAAALLLSKQDKPSYHLGQKLAADLPLISLSAIFMGFVAFLIRQQIHPSDYLPLGTEYWAKVVLALAIGSGLLYLARSKRFSESKSAWLLLLSALTFTMLGYVFSRTISQSALVGNGMARFLHFFISAFAVSGLYIGYLGLRSKDVALSKYAVQLGSLAYAITTLSQFIFGSWYLASLPREKLLMYMGHYLPATIAFGVSFLLTLASLVTAMMAQRDGSKLMFKLTLAFGLIVVLAMLVMRQALV